VVTARYGVICIPGRRDDGRDSAWFVAPVGRYYRPGTSIYVGDGERAHIRALARARRLNVRAATRDNRTNNKGKKRS
jgi:hypothetical protein